MEGATAQPTKLTSNTLLVFHAVTTRTKTKRKDEAPKNSTEW